jgi:hypothetical protein
MLAQIIRDCVEHYRSLSRQSSSEPGAARRRYLVGAERDANKLGEVWAILGGDEGDSGGDSRVELYDCECSENFAEAIVHVDIDRSSGMWI